MKDNLILLTSTFPFGTGETFLETELTYLAQGFSSIIILPTKKTLTQNSRPIPKNCTVDSSIISQVNSESSLRRVISKLFVALKSSFFYQELAEIFPTRINKEVIDNLLTYSRDAALSRKAIQEIRKNNSADNEKWIIYSYWCNGATLGATIAGTDIPVISRTHRGDLYEELHSKNYIPLREKTIANIEVLYSISKNGVQYLSNRYSKYQSKFQLSRLGIPIPDENEMQHNEKKIPQTLTLASCSSINKNKRVDRIALSLKKFASKHPKINLYWNHFGSGPGLNNLKKLTADFPPNLSASLHGHIDNQELLDWYSKNPVHIFINLSKSEGIPVSIMEANSYRIPAIATNVGGTSELVNTESGWLLNRDFNSSEIQATLEEALLKHSIRIQKADKAYKTCLSHFDSGKNYPDFTKKLKEVMLEHDAH
ncbi:MAG: hypothetical protein CL670_07895 [Balneola sp.]|jgi:glycosyltransferase involved in cell wall biosynthesis|nr:hypothetical protein [Balneola sp.]MBE79059.1 hypothetical protein [Balneola sp.]|tara:strand:- start:46482 stop:47759 length:1278 start_codon:yes stop_codon:yes gene_type:complete